MLLHPWDSLFKRASFAPLCLPRCSSDPRSALVTHLPVRYLPSPSSCRKMLEMSDGAIYRIMCVTGDLSEISSEVEQWRSEAPLWFFSSTHRWSFHLFSISLHDEPESLILYDLHQQLTALPPLRKQADHSKALGTITVRRHNVHLTTLNVAANCWNSCTDLECRGCSFCFRFITFQGCSFAWTGLSHPEQFPSKSVRCSQLASRTKPTRNNTALQMKRATVLNLLVWPGFEIS